MHSPSTAPAAPMRWLWLAASLVAGLVMGAMLGGPAPAAGKPGPPARRQPHAAGRTGAGDRSSKDATAPPKAALLAAEAAARVARQMADPDYLSRGGRTVWITQDAVRLLNWRVGWLRPSGHPRPAGGVPPQCQLSPQAVKVLALPPAEVRRVQGTVDRCLAALLALERRHVQIVSLTESRAELVLPPGLDYGAPLRQAEAELRQSIGPVKADLLRAQMLPGMDHCLADLGGSGLRLIITAGSREDESPILVRSQLPGGVWNERSWSDTIFLHSNYDHLFHIDQEKGVFKIRSSLPPK